MDGRTGADLRVCDGFVWKDLTEGRGVSGAEHGGESDAGGELGVASCVAIGLREFHLDRGRRGGVYEGKRFETGRLSLRRRGRGTPSLGIKWRACTG
jgi:hypothetical protein